MAVASLNPGSIGALTGVGAGALVWRVIRWRRSGPVVTVKVNQAWPSSGDHVGEPITSVIARNSGRAPATVTSWGLRLPDGQTIAARKPFPGSDKLPYRLERGASGIWGIETIQVAETCRARGVDYADLRGFVSLADGQTVHAQRKGIQLGPGFPRPGDAGR